MGKAPLSRHAEGGGLIGRDVTLRPCGRVCAGSSASALRSTSASRRSRSESACAANKPSAVGATIVRTTLVGAGSCIARSWCGCGGGQPRPAGHVGREESSRVFVCVCARSHVCVCVGGCGGRAHARMWAARCSNNKQTQAHTNKQRCAQTNTGAHRQTQAQTDKHATAKHGAAATRTAQGAAITAEG
jgi:hypothetical protein